MKPIEKLHALGQSLWYDNIERRLLENSELAALIERDEIRGLTSNPSIFYNAIAKSHDYETAIASLSWAGYSAEMIYEFLAVEDIRAAADLLLPLYRRSSGADGYVSLEVSPALAYDASGTLTEAKRLWQWVDRPNLMIKIPATRAGLPAVRQAIAAGINVNVTLIFSLARYRAVMDAYISGLEDCLAAGLEIGQVASVASFFVSRMDSKVDQRLQSIAQGGGEKADKAHALMGKLAVANTRLAYQEFRSVFEGRRFSRLVAQGARVQRPLWASTSTKNANYPDTLYVDTLIGEHTVNTVPPKTLDAFREHGEARLSVEDDLEDAHQAVADLEAMGFSMRKITTELEKEGVRAFSQAHKDLLKIIEQQRRKHVQDLGPLDQKSRERITHLAQTQVPARLHAVDPTLWTRESEGQKEIRIRLGWLTLPTSSRDLLPELRDFAVDIRQEGFTHLLLLGMGGSSLAPEVMRLIFWSMVPGEDKPGLDLAILDSTDPAQVRTALNRAPIRRTLFIVSSKSGGTAEVNAFLDYAWACARRAVGKRAGEHFIAITDPGTSLEALAMERSFRKVFRADPHVGGRYSALTAFGLVPAALMGLDVSGLLDRAAWMARQCAPEHPAERNPGLVLGAIMGEAALQGRDKLTLIADDGLAPLGAWLEQLIAESSGKQGMGIVPIDAEPPASPELYGADRLFVYLRRSGRYDRFASRLRKAGQPVLTIKIVENIDLGAEFYRWEVATAVACVVLGVNAFDQPDVQDSKTRTKAKIAIFRQQGMFEEGEPAWEKEGIRLYGTLPPGIQSPVEALYAFLRQGRPGDYVALNAYVPRNTEMGALLRRLRIAIQKRTHLATTVGFGPRFLHSTGQLHKGGADNGLFVQITADPVIDFDIPGQGLSFGALERGQALGDLEALQARDRRVLRIHLSEPSRLRCLLEEERVYP
ncbi:MAG: bifunctional transaldolase/phosoglucose isomerase [Anaerolineales bacterium]|nr:bifunctional transaldolase/phosoglucose isomerase [Anaerolineales bacterium]